jgi:hypothetical protein
MVRGLIELSLRVAISAVGGIAGAVHTRLGGGEQRPNARGPGEPRRMARKSPSGEGL